MNQRDSSIIQLLDQLENLSGETMCLAQDKYVEAVIVEKVSDDFKYHKILKLFILTIV